MEAFHSIETPINSVGAVSILRIVAKDVAGVCIKLRIKPLQTGQIRLAPIGNLDEALIARFEQHSLLVMPHGGIGITHKISESLIDMGIGLSQPIDPSVLFPEAEDFYEARMLVALSRTPSPMAVDLLLDQPRRWRENQNPESLADATALNRLMTPPVVVAVGRANIGKSSLVNALAGTSVAMVSDQAGTTRDHVGVMLNLGGLAVRWVDSPGIDERVSVGQELDLLGPVIEASDLIVHAIDHDDSAGQLDPRLTKMLNAKTPILRLGVRSDLGQPIGLVECSCSSQTGEGIETLTTAIIHLLIPPKTLTDPRPWRFWDS